MKKYFITLPLFLFHFTLLAQENCSNGIDDDGDGFVDCYDSDCFSNADCTDFYLGKNTTCQGTVTPTTNFPMRQQWVSADQTASNNITPVIGDLDRDGIPEVMAVNFYTDTLTILDGATGRTKYTKALGFTPNRSAMAIANLNNDDCAEIFVGAQNTNTIAMYDCQLNEVWSVTATGSRTSLISVADFDGDGSAELLHGNEIRNAADGSVIIAGRGDFRTDQPYGSVAVDILPDGDCADCAGLEIVNGGRIYSVNLATRSTTLVKEVNDQLPAGRQYAIKGKPNNNNNTTSIADYNLDGRLDVLFTGGQRDVTGNLLTTVFFWDVSNNAVAPYTVPGNYVNATGRINIADVDGDGQLNAVFVSGANTESVDRANLFALNPDMTLLWRLPVIDAGAILTSCTVFDFNNDGASEIVYRGGDDLYIIRTETSGGVPRAVVARRETCRSRTWDEYPIVADVDGDGETEICVACATNNGDPTRGRFGQIRVFEAGTDRGARTTWQPSRAVWNQHAYFNVNINDDLTVPRVQQDLTKIFATNPSCASGAYRPLNLFLNQAPILAANGCPNALSPDVELVSLTSVGRNQCPETNLDVTIKIKNSGEVTLRGVLPITFYSGNPALATSTKLNTVQIPITGLAKSDNMDITAEVVGPGGDFTLYVSANDSGTQNPPVVSYPSTLADCKKDNNLKSIAVTAAPFTIQFQKVSDNHKCVATKPNNGDARVFYNEKRKTTTTLWRENFEALASGATSGSGATLWRLTTTPPAANTLGVAFTATSKELVFSGLGGQAVWESPNIDIAGQPSVSLSAALRSSTDFSGADDYFNIYYVVDGGAEVGLARGLHNGEIGSVTAKAEGITGNTLKIVVRAKNDSNKESYYLDQLWVQGVTTQEVQQTAGLDFEWTSATGAKKTGSRLTDLAEGSYQILAKSQTNTCQSQVTTGVILRDRTKPDVGITKVQDLTHCGIPNGILEAYVNQGGSQVTTNYRFSWYVGNAAGGKVVHVGARATNLGALQYSVNVVSDVTGCERLRSETVGASQVSVAAPTVNVTNVTDCRVSNSGALTITSATAGLNFKWYRGKKVKSVPDYTTANLTNLRAGFYTVVAEDNITRCTSSKKTVEVKDHPLTPSVTVDVTSNNSCRTLGNGTGTAKGSGITSATEADYRYEFYKGHNQLSANKHNAVSGEQSQRAKLLSGGPYRVVVTHQPSGCVGVKDFEIKNEDVKKLQIPPTPGKPTVLSLTNCNGTPARTTGTVDATVLKFPPVESAKFPSVVNGGFEEPVLKKKPSFDFIHASKAKGWQTTATSGNLEYWTSGWGAPPVQAYKGKQFGEINSDGQGAFYFDVYTTPGILMVWKFAHRGRLGKDVVGLRIGPTPGPGKKFIPNFKIERATDSKAWKLYQGNYRIPAGQTSTRFAFEAVSTAAKHPNGAMNLTVGNFLDEIEFHIAPYFYQLTGVDNKGVSIKKKNRKGIFSGLTSGDYQLTILNNVTGCQSDAIPLKVRNIQQAPTFNNVSPTDDDFCFTPASGRAGSGTIAVDVQALDATGKATTGGYNLTLRRVKPTGGRTIVRKPPKIGSSGKFTFKGLPAGEYEIVAENISAGCSTHPRKVTVGRKPAVYAFEAPTITPQTNCTGNPDGSITIAVGGVTKDQFLWTWETKAGVIKQDIDGSVADAHQLANQVAGTYKVTVKHKTTQCILSKEVIIPKKSVLPKITLTPTADPSCGVGNGQIAATVDVAGTPTTAGYIFQWYAGSTATGTALKAGDHAGNNSNVAFAAGGTHTITGLSGNADYTVKATNTATGCANTAALILAEDNKAIAIGLVMLTPSTQCSPANGELNITNVTLGGSASSSGYNYQWYKGTSSTGTPIANGAGITGATTNHVKGLAAGFYTVVATHRTTKCASPPRTYEVKEKPTAITLAEGKQKAQTHCAGDPSGSVEITAEPSGHTFDYEFFVGGSTAASTKLPQTAKPLYDQVVITNATSSNAATISKLPSGTYTAQATDRTTGCKQTHTFVIKEDLATPIIGTSLTPPVEVAFTKVNTCSGVNHPNGAIELRYVAPSSTAVSDPSAFTYQWYIGKSTSGTALKDGNNIGTLKGSTATAKAIADATTNHIKGLDAGDYTVVATHKTTGCASAPVPMTLAEERKAITTDVKVIKDDFSCNPATPTGEVEANVTHYGGSPVAGNAGFTIRWYRGTNTLLANRITTTTGLQAGTYTAQIIRDDTGCEVTKQVTIKRSVPTITLNTAQAPQTTCNPPNGSATVTPTFTYSGGGAPIGFTRIYSYEWNKGQRFTTGGLGIKKGKNIPSSILVGQKAGHYTVKFKELSSGCSPAPVTIEVADGVTTNKPTATIKAIGRNRNRKDGVIPSDCEAVGTIVADLTASPTAGQYHTFQWYEGSKDYAADPTLGKALVPGTNQLAPPNDARSINMDLGHGDETKGHAALIKVPSGLYTLVMTNDKTKCRYQQVFDLPYIGQQATTTLAIDHVTKCPDNGEATVGLGDNVEVSFTIAGGPKTTFTDGEEVTTPAGAKGVVGKDLRAVASGAGTIYTMDISTREGKFSRGDQITGQSSRFSARIQSVSKRGHLPNSVDDISQYDIYLYAGKGLPANKLASYTYQGKTYPIIKTHASHGASAGGVVKFTGLPAGQYTAVARAKRNPAFNSASTSQCFSAFATGEIRQEAFAPIVNSFKVTDNKNCGISKGIHGNGSILVEARKDARDKIQPNNFEFKWYEKGKVGARLMLTTTKNVTQSTLNQLKPGDYTVIINRLGLAGPAANGCADTTTYTVGDAPVIPAITGATITNIEDCGRKGRIEIPNAQITGRTADYTFTWYKNNPTVASVMKGVGGAGSGGGATMQNQSAGIYYVNATHDNGAFGTNTQCTTPMARFEIKNEAVKPTLSITSHTPNTSCDPDPNEGNGRMAWKINSPLGSYRYQWYVGKTATGKALANGTTIKGAEGTFSGAPYFGILSGIKGGTYTLRVTDTATPSKDCFSDITFTLPENLPVIGVQTAVPTANQACAAPYTGAYEITNVSINGAQARQKGFLAAGSHVPMVPRPPTENFTFSFVKAGGAAHGGTILSSAPNKIEKLAPGDYQVVITDDRNHCKSVPIAFTIADKTALPMVAQSAVSPSTFCNPAPNSGNGELTAKVTEDAAGAALPIGDYTFEWYRGKTSADGVASNRIVVAANTNLKQGTAVTTAANPEKITALSPDDYLVKVTKNDTRCATFATFKVGSKPILPTITGSPTVTDIQDCGGRSTGSIALKDANMATGGVAAYTFAWYQGAAATPIARETADALNNRPAGTYRVAATHSTSGCTTPTVSAEIKNTATPPVLKLTLGKEDTSCYPGSGHDGNGSINWEITSAPKDTYKYQWYPGSRSTGSRLVGGVVSRGESGTLSGLSYTSTLSDINGGTYTLKVTDTATPSKNCAAEVTFVLPEKLPVIGLQTAKNQPNTHCIGGAIEANGTYEVTAVSLDGTPVAGVVGYHFAFTKASGGGHGGQVSPANKITKLAPGDYQVIITQNATACKSSPYRFTIANDNTPPTFSWGVKPNQNCAAPWNGQLTVVKPAGVTSPVYSWRDSTSVAGGWTQQPWISAATPATLLAGKYEVTLKDGVTGCKLTESYTLNDRPYLIQISSFDTQPSTHCAPKGNGSIEVKKVSPTTLVDYKYTFKKDAPAALRTAAVNTPHTGLSTGKYYLQAIRKVAGVGKECSSRVYEVEVKDKSMKPVITLAKFKDQTNCLATKPNGSLTVSAGAGATYSWTGRAVGLPFVPTKQDTYEGLAASSAPNLYPYKVTVTDGKTGCTATESYGISSKENNPLKLSVSKTPNENCIGPNGELAINVLNATNKTAKFEYYVYSGTTTNVATVKVPANLLSSGNDKKQLKEGSYTALVVDTDGGCESLPTPITIDSDVNASRMKMALKEDQALTTCDPKLADGQATVSSVPDLPSRYAYAWYEGTATTGKPLGNTLTVYQLLDKTYTVKMTDRITGCETQGQMTISKNTPPVPAPSVVKKNDESNCRTPDGAIEVAVNGITNGYTFVWKDSTGVTLSHQTAILSALRAGKYFLRAKYLKTGCLSDAVEVKLLDKRSKPAFTVSTTESVCEKSAAAGYAPNGEANLNFTNYTEVDKVYWAADQGVEIDPKNLVHILSTEERFTNVAPGSYRVRIVGRNACTSEQTFQVKAGIKVYNGVSSNGDGKNDYFRITCADLFPKNTLRIYNRDGALVYQTQHYKDALSGNVFTGQSNVGSARHNLPSGTYFYIFEKGDAQEAKNVYQGFLELVK